MIYAENVLICIAVPLAVSLLFTKGSARRCIASFLTGMIVCILSAYISGFFEETSGFSSEDGKEGLDIKYIINFCICRKI